MNHDHSETTDSISPTIVVGLGPSRAARNAVRWSINRAVDDGALLVVVTACADPLPVVGALGSGVPIVMFDNVRQRALEWQRSVVESLLDVVAIRPQFELVVEAGSPASVLLRSARDAGLLVLGSSGGRWRPTLRRCVRRSVCPVEVIERSTPDIV